jgi:hypothetical protein
VKTAQGQEALSALATIPATIGEENYGANVEELATLALPKTMFTELERQEYIVSAAVAASINGDTRLWDYANSKFGAETLFPQQAANIKRNKRDFDKQATRSFWNEAYASYEQRANAGEFTEDDWNKLITNQSAIDNLGGRSKIDSWLAQGNKARQKAVQLADYYRRFTQGDPMINATPDDINQVVDTFMAENAGRPSLDAVQDMAALLGKQNVVSTDLKTTLQSALGRQILTPEMANNDQFQTAFTIASALSDNMSNDQLLRQMGEEAFDTFWYLEDTLKFNGNNFADAIGSLSAAQDYRKKHNLEFHPTSEEYKQLDESLRDVLDGSVETSDPNISGFLGWTSRSDNAIITGGVQADIRRQAELLVLRGRDPKTAIMHATRKVAARYQEFGGEQHYTAGAGIAPLVGLPNGTDKKMQDAAWEFYAGQMGKDPDQVRPQITNGMLTLVDIETGAETPPVLARAIGDMYQAKMIQDISDQKVANEEDRIQNMQDATDVFNRMLYGWYGPHNGKKEFIDGVTIADYERATLEKKMEYYEQWRHNFNSGTRNFAKIITTAGDWWANAGREALGWFNKKSEQLGAALDTIGKKSPTLSAEEMAEYKTLSPEQKELSQRMTEEFRASPIVEPGRAGGAGGTAPADEGAAETRQAKAPVLTSPQVTDEGLADPPASQYSERGLRNNNPGNIEHSRSAWQGLAPSADKRFASFSEPVYGIRAMARVLMNYKSRYGISTVKDLVNRWSYAAEDPAANRTYISQVAKAAGVAPEDTIDLADESVLSKILPAIIKHENGKQPYSQDLISDAIRRAQR